MAPHILPWHGIAVLLVERYVNSVKGAEQILRQARRRLGIPSMFAALWKTGKPVWAAAIGWADVEQRVQQPFLQLHALSILGCIKRSSLFDTSSALRRM